MLDLALVGFGPVGRAFAARLPAGARLVAVADRSGVVADPGGLDAAALVEAKTRDGSLGADAGALPPVDITIDALPTDLRTGEPSLGLALRALAQGSHVVTASKGALALHAPLVSEAAARAGRVVRGSATVGAGTPVLELLSSAFGGDTLEGFDAVLNGSTTFVLSRLEEGASWDDALREARGRGYLEADPSLDLLGLDAAAKAVILANHAWGPRLRLADVDAQGIAGVTREEAMDARRNGFALRLVARATPDGRVAVGPAALPRDHALVAEGAQFAARLKFADAGVITLRGPGAGPRETAAALRSDVLALPISAPVAKTRSGEAISKSFAASPLRIGGR